MKISIQEAAERLKKGEVVGVPTETVYGLAASLENVDAIKNIFYLKKRPQDNPLIIHISSIEQIYQYVETLPNGFEELATRFWPGPLTLVIPTSKNIPNCVRAGLDTAAFRMPNHEMALKLIDLTGPLVMPSANLSGTPSSTKLEHVENDFGSDFPVIDGSPSMHGIESTILIAKGDKWEIGRLGAISVEELESYLKYKINFISKSSNNPICPGQKYRHYAPKAKIFTGKTIPEECQVVIGFKEKVYEIDKPVLYFGSIDDPMGAGNRLYDLLREIDQNGFSAVWVDLDFPDVDLWKSIRERLLKASNQ